MQILIAGPEDIGEDVVVGLQRPVEIHFVKALVDAFEQDAILLLGMLPLGDLFRQLGRALHQVIPEIGNPLVHGGIGQRNRGRPGDVVDEPLLVTGQGLAVGFLGKKNQAHQPLIVNHRDQVGRLHGIHELDHLLAHLDCPGLRGDEVTVHHPPAVRQPEPELRIQIEPQPLAVLKGEGFGRHHVKIETRHGEVLVKKAGKRPFETGQVPE